MLLPPPPPPKAGGGQAGPEARVCEARSEHSVATATENRWGIKAEPAPEQAPSPTEPGPGQQPPWPPQRTAMNAAGSRAGLGLSQRAWRTRQHGGVYALRAEATIKGLKLKCKQESHRGLAPFQVPLRREAPGWGRCPRAAGRAGQAPPQRNAPWPGPRPPRGLPAPTSTLRCW